MTKKIKGVPLNLNKRGCTAISSNCITWQGPDIPCLDLCKGSTVSEVIYNLGLEFCKLYEDLSPESYNLECLNLDDVCNLTFKDIFQALIDKVCDVQTASESCNLYAKILPGEGGFSVEIENGVAPYTYEWSIADNMGMFQIISNPTGATATVNIVDPNAPSFDACNSTNAGNIGMLRVKVTDSKMCIATDTFLLVNVICE
jgi:hypothetical protein